MVMARAATDVAVSRKDLIVEQKLPDRRFVWIEDVKVVRPDRNRKVRTDRARKDDTQETDKVKYVLHSAILTVLVGMASPLSAEIEEARDMMEAGQFEEARKALWPAARSGNADAEELIGIMYALGLGVEQDYERAFEWYLRSSMKGHPGAQSGVGWYYEVGLGMPEPDLVRAYMWYNLSAIGGDPDAAISLEEVVKKMTQEEIDRALVLVDDYKPWLYPFR